MKRALRVLSISLALWAGALHAQPKITFSIPSGIAPVGTPATVIINYSGAGVAGIQTSFLVPTGTVITPDPSLAAVGKQLYSFINASKSATIVVVGGILDIPDGPVGTITFSSIPFVFAPLNPLATSAAGSAIVLTATGVPYKNLCDLNSDGVLDTLDIRNIVDQIDGAVPCTNGDLNADLRCTILDAQRVVNAVAGGACVIGK